MKRIVEATSWAWQWVWDLGWGRVHARTDLHLARKAWHMAMGVMMVGVYLFSGISQSTAVLLLGSALGLDLLMETLRLRNPQFNQIVFKWMAPIVRQCEKDRLSGIPFYVGATFLAIAIFPKEIAALSVLLLAFSDPVASLIGILYGDYGPRFKNGKSLIGTAAGVATATLVSASFLSLFAFQPHEYLILTLIGGVTGGTAEMLPVDLDDNFLIPMVSGFSLWLAYIILGIPG